MKILATALALLIPAVAGDVTFYRDGLPILQTKCQSCHRSGELAPMYVACPK